MGQLNELKNNFECRHLSKGYHCVVTIYKGNFLWINAQIHNLDLTKIDAYLLSEQFIEILER